MELNREELLMKLGAARTKAPAAWRLVDIAVAEEKATFSFALNRARCDAAKAATCCAPTCAARTRRAGDEPNQDWGSTRTNTSTK
jgi:hypothetical protein